MIGRLLQLSHAENRLLRVRLAKYISAQQEDNKDLIFGYRSSQIAYFQNLFRLSLQNQRNLKLGFAPVVRICMDKALEYRQQVSKLSP